MTKIYGNTKTLNLTESHCEVKVAFNSTSYHEMKGSTVIAAAIWTFSLL